MTGSRRQDRFSRLGAAIRHDLERVPELWNAVRAELTVFIGFLAETGRLD